MSNISCTFSPVRADVSKYGNPLDSAHSFPSEESTCLLPKSTFTNYTKTSQPHAIYHNDITSYHSYNSSCLSNHSSLLSPFFPDLVATNHKHHTVQVGRRVQIAPHLSQPAIETLKAVSVGHIVHQHGALCVLVELIANLSQQISLFKCTIYDFTPLDHSLVICINHSSPLQRSFDPPSQIYSLSL